MVPSGLKLGDMPQPPVKLTLVTPCRLVHDYALEIVNRTRKTEQLASGRQPAWHAHVAASGTSPRFSRWPRLLFAGRLQAACRCRFFAPRGGQLAPCFASKKIGDDRIRSPGDCRLRSRTSVSLASTAAQLWAKADRSAVRAFFLSITALAFALLLAIYSGTAAELGHLPLAIASALGALLVAAWVAVTLVPVLAKRTPLRWIGYKMEYRVTREGWIYILGIFLVAVAALNTGNNLLFLILASLIAIILMSGVLSSITLSGVEMRLQLPEHIFAGPAGPLSRRSAQRKADAAFVFASRRSRPRKTCRKRSHARDAGLFSLHPET